VQHTGQTDPSQKAPKHQTGLPSSKLTQTRNSNNTGGQRTHPNVHPSKTQQGSAPVRPVRGTGQTEQHPRVNTPNPNPDLPNRSTDLRKTLGIVGTPHGESIAKFMSTKTCQIKRNQRNPAKNSSNPRAPKTPKIEPLNSQIWEGNQREKNHEGFTHTSPTKSLRARSRKRTKKTSKRGLRKSPPRTNGNNTTKP
jgi:hypothetical protein